jgi:hypothetical protein
LKEKVQQPAKVLITQTKIGHMYVELWHASKCVLERGIENEIGSSWQFLSSIVLTAFSFEAYVNHVGERLLIGWQDHKRLPPLEKLELVCQSLNILIQKGERPFQTLQQLQDFRNDMAHGKTKTIEGKPFIYDADRADARLGQRFLADWEKLIETKEFAERARADVEKILTEIHHARTDEKESLFAFRFGTSSATLIETRNQSE